MDLVISGLVLLVIGGLGIFLIRKFMLSLQKSFNINGHIPAPNGAGKHISLTRVNGCGMSFMGNYRRANIDQIETLCHILYSLPHFCATNSFQSLSGMQCRKWRIPCAWFGERLI